MGETESIVNVGDIEGSDMWLEEFTEENHVGKMAMLLGRRVVGMDKMAAVKIENVIMAEVLRWWKKGRNSYFKSKPLTILVSGPP